MGTWYGGLAVELIEKSLTGASEHLVDFFEAVVSAVVGVGDILGFGEGGVVGAHEFEFGIRDFELAQVAVVGGVHWDDVVEAFDVG